MTIKQLQDKIKKANYFYRIGTPIIPDSEYDLLVDNLNKLEPDNDLLSQIGYNVTDRKVKLPITMASMNKIKTIEEFVDWLRLKNISADTQFILTPKYDGLSLCVNEKYQLAFTRGDGVTGQLATMHYEKMQNKLTDNSDMQFTYGEAIIPKKVFLDTYSGEFANARNTVSGLLNSKEASDYLKDCVYIKYGAHGHNFKTKAQLLDRLNLEQEWKVPYVLVKATQINNELITQLFNNWSKDFEIDGLIIEVNNIELQDKLGRETSTNNPVWARALKHKSFESSAKSHVKNITWNISKQGLLKPTINIEPVSLDGVVISNVTGNNARYIKEMGIGIGSEVLVVRSGMVIPVITEVITKKPFVIPKEFDVEWNENGVELVLKTETEEQVIQKVVSFFEILEAKGISEGILKQILEHNNGKWKTFKEAIDTILKMKPEDMLSIYRFGNRKSTATFNAIQNAVSEVSLAKLQHASGVFMGLGSKKLELLKHFDSKPTVEEVMEIDGFAEKSAKVFVDNWDRFYNFISDLSITIKQEINDKVSEKSLDLIGISFCFTGVRLTEVEKEIVSRGGSLASGVSKKTTYLVTKSKGSGSSKETKAVEFGVKVMDVEELYLFLNENNI